MAVTVFVPRSMRDSAPPSSSCSSAGPPSAVNATSLCCGTVTVPSPSGTQTLEIARSLGAPVGGMLEGGYDLERFPALGAWLERIAALPGYVPTPG